MIKSENNMIDSSSDSTEKQFGPDCLTRLLGSLFPLLYQPYRDIFHSVDLERLIEDALNDHIAPYGDDDYDWDSEIASLRELHQNEALKGDMTICNPLVSQNATSTEFICASISCALKELSPNGCAGLIVPLNMLSTGGCFADIAKSLVESKNLLAVIQLPEKLFAPAFDMPSCLLLADRKRYMDQILFIKPNYVKANDISLEEQELISNYCTGPLSNWKESALISSYVIRKQSYQLSPVSHVSSLKKELKQLQEKGSFKALGEICKVQAGKQPEKTADKLNIVERIAADSAVKDYTHPCNNYYGLLRRSLGPTSAGVFSAKHTAISEKCLLATFNESRIAAQVFDPSKSFREWPHEEEWVTYRYEGINIDKDIVALFPDENVVAMEYLYYQLYSPLVTMQIEAIINALDKMNSDPFNERGLNDTDWESLIIPVPSVDKQRDFVDNQSREIIELMERRDSEAREVAAIRLGVDVRFIKKEAEFQIVKHLGHSLNRRIGNVESIMTKLEHFINRKGLSTEALQETYYDGQEEIIVKDKISEALNDLRQMHRLIRVTRELVTKGKGELKEEDFKLIDVSELFNSHILAKYKDHNFKISFSCPEGVKAILHESSFIEAIDNIVNNAEEHAFKNRDSGNEIFFWIHNFEDQIVIDYANNGAPFPTDITEDEFLEFGVKGKSSNGTGLGGAYVKLMLEAHNASFEIIGTPRVSFNFQPDGELVGIEDKGYLKYGAYFRITIPKRRSNEQED